MISVEDKKYGCQIRIHRKDYYCSEPKLVLQWEGFSFQQYNKWLWYFRYRTALEQVKHPRNYVELAQFSYEYVPTREQELKRQKDKITAKKAKITACLNKVAAYKAQWNFIFPITSDPAYQLAMAKIERLKEELAEMERAYAELLQPSKII